MELTLEFRSMLKVLGFLVLCLLRDSRGETSTCLAIYREGGAPAVFQSPKCPRWKLTNRESRPRPTPGCHTAMLRGRRRYQEDRVLCALDLRIPFPGKAGIKEVVAGIVAVFDGHNGAEASEMASKLLLEYFALHTYFLLDATYSIILKTPARRLLNKGVVDTVHTLKWDEVLTQHALNIERLKFPLSQNFDDSVHFKVLEEALMRAIRDIDAKFTKEAYRKTLDSGSTATVVLIVDGQIIVANIGDSKAFLCSEKFQSPQEAKATFLRLYREKRRNGDISPSGGYGFNLESSDGISHFVSKELTRDHHPNRDDERVRIEAAGGYVIEWGGVPRVNGQLAVSRAIGDVSFKSYGVISAPEVTDWQPLTANDSFVVAASDGIFERMSSQDVCDFLWEINIPGRAQSKPYSFCSDSLAECLVNIAFEKGSTDNVAAVVVPLHLSAISQSDKREQWASKDTGNSAAELQRLTSVWPSSVSDLVEVKHAHPLTTVFNRLLVEDKYSRSRCFYLSENFNDDVDDALQTQKGNMVGYGYEEPQALPGSIESFCGGPLNSYSDQNLCLQLGVTTNDNLDRCVNPEVFANLFGLLESIPFQDFGSSNASHEFATPDSRYVLKKRFGRGAYGEVWLAFHWHCNGGNASSWNAENRNASHGCIHIDQCNHKPYSNTSAHDWDAIVSDRLFILKRIMVEKGPAVYLSGLREKHFGELFLNASKRLGVLLSTHTSFSSFEDPLQDSYEEVLTHNVSLHKLRNSVRYKSKFTKKPGPWEAPIEVGLNHIVRYVESFESRTNDIWLVFHHEGVSLSKLMYTVERATSEGNNEKVEEGRYVQLLRPSDWWKWLKTTEAGKEEMRSIIWQLLLALKSCHDRNITHRDVKPENMVICFEDLRTGRCLKDVLNGDKNFSTKMRIIDFGSALDEYTIKHLYGSIGPSRAEQTEEYAPPEALLNISWHRGPNSMNVKYDIWSVGVVILEMILGSPNVFQISSVTRALLDRNLEGWSEKLKELAYKLRSFMEHCILIPGSSLKYNHTAKQGVGSPASWKCSEEYFSNQIKARDPLKLGFPNIMLLRLVRQLLLWDPEVRLSVDDALCHPYFQPPPSS